MAMSLTEGISLTTLKQFEVLQQRFVAGLPARWLEIIDAPDSASQQAALHRLCGSAGSFGFESICHLAREADMLATTGDRTALAQCLIRLAAVVIATDSTT